MSAETQNIRIIAFPGAPNLPIFVAMEEGFFAREGVSVEIEFTPSSIYQAQKTAAGAFDIAMTAFDNVVAYGEGQGAAGPGNLEETNRHAPAPVRDAFADISLDSRIKYAFSQPRQK